MQSELDRKRSAVVKASVRAFVPGLAGIVATLAALIPAAESSEPLRASFEDPPPEFSMVPLWSWNGSLDRETLRFQIDELVDKGVYGAFMHARAGIEDSDTPYFSDGWWDAVSFCVEYGESVGFSPWIYDEDKWPSGAAGGRTIARNPERNSQKALHRVEQRITGPSSVEVAFPDARFVIAARMVNETTLDPATLTDISLLNRDGNGQIEPWHCPAGDWLIAAYIFGPYGHGVNYLNRDTVRDFIDITHETYAHRIGPAFGATVPGVFFDEIMNDAGKSPEHVVWVEGFEDRFRELKGYDVASFLPALTYDIGPRTPVIRCDYYDVYTTLYEEAWFEQIADWCTAHNLMLSGHTVEELNRYITQGDYMRTQRHLQIPTTDNEDFRYTWPRTIGAWKPKQLASIAQLYQRPRAAVEAMGGAGWSFTLDSGRYGFNMLAAYGIDFYISHLFHYAQVTPAQVGDWPNSWFYRNPYWKYFKTFADHGSRISYMLRGATPVVDVAILYPQANQWSGNGPGTTQDTLELLVASAIDANLIDTDSLLRAEIRERRLVIGELSFQCIVVPGVECIRTAELAKIAQFSEAGGTVLIHNCYPSTSMEQGRDDPRLAPYIETLRHASVTPELLERTVDHLSNVIGRDVTVVDEPTSPLRYRHVRRGLVDIYWIVNSSRKGGSWRVRFRTKGQPECWQPESGRITPVRSFLPYEDGTECEIDLDAWQGCFIVFDPQSKDESELAIAATNLNDARIEGMEEGKPVVAGWLPKGESVAQITLRERGKPDVFFGGGEEAPTAPAALPLDSLWEFLPVDHQLDHEWRIDIASTELELPVMRVRWEHTGEPASSDWADVGFNDRNWREVKVRDAQHADAGAIRYRSRWNGQFISFYPYTPFNLDEFFVPVVGGKKLSCRKKILLGPENGFGWIAVVCPGPYRVFWNGEQIGAGGGGEDGDIFPIDTVRPGESTLEIVADDAPAVLAEGEFLAEYGTPVTFQTDSSWETRVSDREWIEAAVYVSPPEKPYGEPAHPRRPELPQTVWYRQDLPPGISVVYAPEIEGDWDAWLDGAPLTFARGQARVASQAKPKSIAIRATLSGDDRGLLSPVQVQCRPSWQRLGSWTDLHLAWYSGRVLYATDFTLDNSLCNDETELILDLGKVCYNAEVWVNNTLVDTRVWPPYRVNITDYVKKGKNRLAVVVANLLANRMRWDIFDDSKPNLIYRRWHDTVLLRDGWCFESGLIGPVRIEPARRVRVTISTESEGR